ncbi:hypothetical protein D9M71_523500 [compost metagenome]
MTANFIGRIVETTAKANILFEVISIPAIDFPLRHPDCNPQSDKRADSLEPAAHVPIAQPKPALQSNRKNNEQPDRCKYAEDDQRNSLQSRPLNTFAPHISLLQIVQGRSLPSFSVRVQFAGGST